MCQFFSRISEILPDDEDSDDDDDDHHDNYATVSLKLCLIIQETVNYYNKSGKKNKVQDK